ncbi:EGF-like domain-containing protein [Ditylenchus destructor]|nr:EGF-like domain-containing protein [Ditylenchus destructor]
MTYDCASSPCALGATCHDLINDFECECPHGFSGKRCHVKDDLCEPNPCLNGMCVDLLFDRHCVCKPGWRGAFCEENIDECATNPCMNGATCRDKENGYVCECAPGFRGAQCQHMVDHCAVSPCRNNATCVNRGPKYECKCRLGYEGVHCEHNIDECELLSKCDPQGTELCEDQVNGFQCHCRAGYTGEFCNNHVNQCESEPCQNNATCVDMGTTFQCECPRGWRGERCSETEPQFCDQKPCQNEGKCVTLVGDYFCVCPEGVNGKNCEIAPNRCIGEPCRNGGVCGDFGSRLECTCPKGFVGTGCQYRLDACRTNTCKNGATCMQESEIAYKCICPPGFTGPECATNIDECSPSPCPLSATCIDQINSHHCQCPFNMTGPNCEKKVDPDYDLHFFEGGLLPASASLAVPFKFSAGAISIALWVRFEQPHSKGTFFTLYDSSSPNYSSQLVERIRMTADAVHISLFENTTGLTLPFPPHQRPNDGRWNHVVFSWSSHLGQYSLVWNAVRLFSDKGYAPDNQLNMNAFINLGDAIATAANGSTTATSSLSSLDAKFVGSITRVNMWTRVIDFEQEIPAMVQRCQGSTVLFNGLASRFTGYDRLVGKVERIARSTCGRDGCPAGPGKCNTGLESQSSPSIRVESCPGDMFVVSPMKEVNISWPEPVFSGPLDRVEQNLKSGQVFTWGEHTVLYAAYAVNQSAVVECTFKVHVTKEFCPEPEDPIHGIQACESWGPNLKYKACSIQCESDYAFSRPPAVFYTCADDGQWRPREQPAGSTRAFRYPQCTKAKSAVRLARMHLQYPHLSLCNLPSKNTLAESLNKRINQLNSNWSICASNTDGNNPCDGVNIVVECGGQTSTSGEPIGVRIEIPLRRDAIIDAKGGQKVDALEVLQNEILTKDLFNLEQVLPNGRPDLRSFSVKNVFNCEAGYVAVQDNCVPCARGSYFDSASGECALCPTGQYQPQTAQMSCFSCPSNMPVTEGIGSIEPSECKARCEPGHFFNVEHNSCEACGYGFYQPSNGAFECLPCGIGKTTLETISTQEDDCRDECPDGEQLIKSGTCQPCPIGTYRTKGVDKHCQECPPGTTTEGTNTVKRTECNTPKCMPGQFLVTATKQCQFCPRGAYQDQPLQTNCKFCSPDYMTPTEGATHESQCYSTNQCETSENNCSWHAKCIDLPDKDDVPSFQCVCLPGWVGNGTHCRDACINRCLNDGICRKNQLGHPECVCKENFSGEVCQIRFQPRSQKIAYITAGIGGVVLLLILIVVVIWMISFRFNRNDNDLLNTMEKPSMLRLDSPMSSNFLYGRPALADRTGHSSLAGTIRPIGYYYEDDAPYEQSSHAGSVNHHSGGQVDVKSIFLGADAQNGQRNGEGSTDNQTITDSSEGAGVLSGQRSSGAQQQTRGGPFAGDFGQSANSANSASRELEQRMRNIQQHMYRPSRDDRE